MRSINDITQKFTGTRVMVLKLQGPTKKGGLYIPDSYRRDEKTTGQGWRAQVVAFGLDSEVKEAYNLTEGDIVVVADIEAHADCLAFKEGPCLWVDQWNIIGKDEGTTEAVEAMALKDEHIRLVAEREAEAAAFDARPCAS